MRKYTTGSNWAIWRWSEVDSQYITRLHLIKTPAFAICLHWLHKRDPEPYLHDHPVSFLSLILRGGYVEVRGKRKGDGWFHLSIHRRNWFNFIRASANSIHSIIEVKPRTLTLALMGPKTREWGFNTNDGWRYWRDYYRDQRAGRHNGSSQKEAPDE